MTETIKLPDWETAPMGRDTRYGSLEELQELLLYKRIVKWDKNHLELEDGIKVTIEMSAYDCCAYASGKFKDVKLDAVITNIEFGKPIKECDDGDTTTCKNIVTIYHNQNPVALAECEADNGNGGYYNSVCSLVIGKIHFPVAEA